ncbi:MAG: hypothetical protein JWP96_945 [Polaromonas sp.]|nr:hypothetical protein [Polaromonas sp.]
MNNPNLPVSLLSNPDNNLAKPLSWRAASALVMMVLGLTACDRRSESSPGSTPAAVGSGHKSSGRTEAGTPSSGVEVRTPAAPDTRNGGSTGSAGVVPTPDTSGGPSSGSTGSGASNSGVASINRSAPTGSASSNQNNGTVQVTPPVTSTNGGAPASSLGNSGASSGNTNSTPQSNTGGR